MRDRKELVAKIIAAYKNGYSNEEIAKYLFTSESTVRAITSKYAKCKPANK